MEYYDRLMTECRTETGPYLRPFAPNPHWESAEVFIIGENPATPLRGEFDSFEQYWRGLTVDPAIFQRIYRTCHTGGASKTSGWVDYLIQSLAPLNVLVTNVSWYPARRVKYTPDHQRRRSDRLQELIAHCRPKALFAHGRGARKFVEERFGVEVDPYRAPSEQQSFADGMLILGYHHLTGQGLRKGACFEPEVVLPEFGELIKRFVRGENVSPKRAS